MTKAGVGTNRYAYAGNDPVNLSDPGGNWVGADDLFASVVGAAIGLVAQGVIDIATGHWSSGKDYTASLVAGAAAGEAALYTGPFGAGLTYGAVHAVTRAGLDGTLPTAGNLALETAGGGLGGAVGGKVVNRMVNNLSAHAKGSLGEMLTQGKFLAKGYIDLGKARVPTGTTTPTGRAAQAHYDHHMYNVFTGTTKTVESKFNRAILSKNQRLAQPEVASGLEISRTTSSEVAAATATAPAAVVVNAEDTQDR